MLLRLYRGIGPGSFLIIIFTAILVWLPALIDPAEPVSFHDQNPAPLYSVLLHLFSGRLFAGTVFSLVLVIITGIYLTNLNTRLFFINERTFLPASLFVLFSGYLTANQVFNPVLPALLLLLVAIDRILGSYRKPGIAFNYFDASVLIGIASLIYINTIWFYILVIIGIALIRTFNIRELMVSVFGLALPFLILYSYYYLAGRDISGLTQLFVNGIITKVPDYYWSPVLIVSSIINGLILLISLIHLWTVFNKKKVKSRKVFALFIWCMFLTAGIFFLVPAGSVETMFFFMIPLVYVNTHYLIMMRNKKIANLIFAIFLISILLIQLNSMGIIL